MENFKADPPGDEVDELIKSMHNAPASYDFLEEKENDKEEVEADQEGIKAELQKRRESSQILSDSRELFADEYRKQIKIENDNINKWGVSVEFTEIPWKVTEIVPDQQFDHKDIEIGTKIVALNDQEITADNTKELEEQFRSGEACSMTFVAVTSFRFTNSKLSI